MKKTLAIAALALLFVSCKKNSDDDGSVGTNTIQANVGGTSYNFSVSTHAQKNISGGTTILTLTGVDGTAATSNLIGVYASTTSIMAAGTYAENGTTTDADVVFAQNISGGSSYNAAGSTTNPVSVTITSISATSVQGTFKGDIYLGADITAAKKTVLNGKFNVNF